jgi:hypothetical protein
MNHHDGAHTHHDHHTSGLWIAVVAGLVLALSSSVIASAITALVHVLVLTAIATGCLILTGLAVWLIATRMPARQHRFGRRRIRQQHYAVRIVPHTEHSEVASLRAEMAAVSQQLAVLHARDTHSLDHEDYAALTGRSLGGDGR